MRPNKFKAETFISTLAAVMLFSVLFLGYTHRQKDQTAQLNYIYQQHQALQIAENQISLKLAGMPCESHFQENRLSFRIKCDENDVRVIFPLGEVKISAP